MQLYIYAKSGHSFGLENVRRVSAISNMLQSSDPILCTADYRAATFAKSQLGVKKGVGIDVIGNLPHVMERGDMLIFDDSGEASDTMQSHMKEFCKHLYKVGTDIPNDIVDDTYLDKIEIKKEKAIFFADDDYANWFLDLAKKSNKIDIPLLLGHYFFLGNEDELSKCFSEIIEEDDYIETIKSTKYLLTSSVQSVIESIASGNCPVYFKRADKEEIENHELLKKYNVPIIDISDLDNLNIVIERFEEITKKYPSIKKYDRFDISDIKKEIEDTIKLFEHIQPSLEYKF
ncbi:MAG: hypothetical protein U9R37_06790 [Campylobacterota bacterium]|nr:hypothetical protein [Campylobacterota bacterium]